MKTRKKNRSRRKANANVTRTFAAASAFLGYSAGYLKQLRDAGCAGFRPSGRIHCDEVKAWMLANANKLPEPVGWKDALGREKLRDAKRRNDLADGLLIEKAVVCEQLQKLFRPMIARIEAMLTNEYPSKVTGLDVPSARIYGKRVLDVILDAHREAALQWRT